MGKLYLIEAAVDADYTWLGVAIAIGTMISLAYYLRVVAAIWMRPAAEPMAPGTRGDAGDGGRLSGGRPSPDGRAVRAPGRRSGDPGPAAIAAATIFFGVIPSPLVDWASNAGQALAPFIG